MKNWRDRFYKSLNSSYKWSYSQVFHKVVDNLRVYAIFTFDGEALFSELCAAVLPSSELLGDNTDYGKFRCFLVDTDQRSVFFDQFGILHVG